MKFNGAVGYKDPIGASAYIQELGKQAYSSLEDPRSFESRMNMANVLHTAFPNISQEEAFKNYNQVIKASTGYDVDANSAWQDMKDTFSSAWNDMKASATMYEAMMQGKFSGDYQSSIAAAIEKIGKLKTGKRTDYKNYSGITDAFMQAANILPSTLSSIATEGGGMVLGSLAGNPQAGLIAGRTLNAASVYMQEAGSLALELVGSKDEEGNSLDNNLIVSAMSLVGALNGVIEFGMDSAIQNIASAFVGKIGKKAVRTAISNGTIKQWALKQIRQYGSNMGTEAMQESLQDLVSNIAGDYVRKQANKEGSDFDIRTWEQYRDSMINTAISTAKGMAVIGLAPGAKTVIHDITYGDPSYILSANKYSTKNDSSSTIKTADIKTGEVSPSTDTGKFKQPVQVLQVGDLYKPLDKDDASRIQAMKNSGAKALHVEMANEQAETTESSFQAAKNIASALGASYKDGNIVFKTPQEAREEAISYAFTSDAVVGFQENSDGSYTLARDTEGNRHAITFTDESNVQDAISTPKPEQTENMKESKTQTILNTPAEKLARNTDQKSKRRFFAMMDSLSHTKSDRTFLEQKVVNTVAEAFLSQNPDMDTTTAYDIGRSTAVWAKIVSNLAGQSAQVFYGENFTKSPIAIITPEMEARLKDSKSFRESVKVDRNMNGKNGLSLDEDIQKRGVSGFLGTDGNGLKTIYIGKDADAITVSHELAHALVDSIKDTKKFDTFREIYADEIERDGGDIGRNFQERFAQDFETYIKEGKARSPKVRQAMKAIADAIKGLIGYVGRELDEPTREAFDNLFDLGLKEKPQKRSAQTTEIEKTLENGTDPDSIAEAVAKLADNRFKLRNGKFEVSDVIQKYQDNSGLSESERQGGFSIPYPVLNYQLFMYRLPLDSDRKLPMANIIMTPGAVRHILEGHGKEGVTLEHIARIAEQLDSPVMVLKSDSSVAADKGWPLFVTDMSIDVKMREGTGFRIEKQPLVIAVKPTEEGNAVYSMFPWKPYLQGGRSIADAIQDGFLLAYNEKKTEALVPSTNRLRVEDLIQKTSDTNRIIKLDSLVKPEEEGLLKISNAVKEEQRRAVKEALEHNEYPSDEVLHQFEGDPDVDWEMQFRRIIRQDSQLMQTFSDVHDKLAEESENGEVSHDTILKALEEATADEGIDLTEEVGNVDKFIERMKWQSRYIGPTQADTVFRHNLTNDEFLTDVCKVLAKGIDYAGFTNLSPHIFALARKENPSSYSVRMARQEIRNDLREYRRKYLERTGQKQQLSYENTVEGTYLDNGHEVESFGNEEVKSLLEKDISPVIKSLVRKNLASASTVQSLLDAMEEQRGILSDEIGEKDLSIERITKLLDDLETKGKTTEGRYKDLQGRNQYNYEQMRRYRSLLNTMTMRRDLLETEKTINKISSQIDRAVKPSKQADSRMMQQMDTLLHILKQEENEGTPLQFDAIPQQLKPFFTQDGEIVVAKTGFDKMSISQLAMLRNALRAVKSDAKLIKTERDQAKRDRVFPVIQQYMMQTQGVSPESLEAYRKKMDELKFAKGPRGTIDGAKKDQPHRFTALLENQFITPSRLLRKIDGENGTALYTYFFGGIGSDGKLHKGLEGVIDEEKRREFDRYDAGRKRMQELGITEKMLYSNLTDSLGKKFSVDEAIGVYVYSKQPQAVKHLLSPDGNRLTEAEIQRITDGLTENQKAWGDWLVQDMGSRYEAISDVYYRVHNKPLGKVAQYFPLVRLGKNESFSDLMEDQFLAMQENADDSITKKRTGGDYQLRLDATVIWNRMVQKQEHYIAGAEYFSDANYMLNKNGGDLSNLIAINSGTKYAQGVQDFVNRVANSRHIQDDADSMANAIRNNMIVARLGFNMLTALKQIPTLGLFLTKFGPVRFLEAIAHMTVHYKDTTAFIYDKAPQLKNRNISTDYSSLMDMEGKNAYQRTVKKIGEIGMTPIKWADDMVVNVLWYGAYQDTLSKTGDSELAAMEATKWINDTQPGGTTKDSSAIYASNSTLWKFLLMFSNQLNKNFNIAYDIPYALKQGMYSQALRSTLGLGLSFAGIMLLEGGMKEDDEDDDKYIQRALREFGSQTASMMPVFGKELSDAISGRYYSDSGLPMISEGFSFVKALGTDDMEQKVDRAVKLGLSGLELTGAPTGQVNKVWNVFTKEDEINLGYLLGSDFAK